jgi:branched-chain amino acid transport system substrate-binding protein
MNRRAFLASLAFASSTGLFVTEASAERGVSSTEIALGMWSPLTGPTALLGVSERDAIEIAIEEVNADGGVNGRKLKLAACRT